MILYKKEVANLSTDYFVNIGLNKMNNNDFGADHHLHPSIIAIHKNDVGR